MLSTTGARHASDSQRDDVLGNSRLSGVHRLRLDRRPRVKTNTRRNATIGDFCDSVGSQVSANSAWSKPGLPESIGRTWLPRAGLRSHDCSLS
jgi:hypothetical protein